MANNIVNPVVVKAVWDISASGTLATNKSYAPGTSTNSDNGYVEGYSVIIPEGALQGLGRIVKQQLLTMEITQQH